MKGERAARRLALVLLLALGLSSIGLTAWSIGAGGIGWDARLDTYSALNIRSTHAKTLQAAYAETSGTSEQFYGVFVEQAGDLLHRLTTGSKAWLGPDDPAAYHYQATVTLILAVAAVTALAAVLALALRSLLPAAFAWSLTLATPLWLGMEHVDFKDVPVAAGVTLVTCGLALAFMLSRTRALIAGIGLAAAGGAVAMATRPASIVLLVAVALGAIVPAAILRRGVPQVVLAGVAALVVGLAFTWATDPIARLGLVQWLHDSVDVARKFPWTRGPVRAGGKDLQAAHLPWWYVPGYLGVQLPLLTLAVVVGSIGVLAVRIRRLPAIPLVPLAVQAIGIPIVIVASGAVLYDGIRQLLFLLPALLALPAFAFALLDGGRLRAALPVAAVVVVAASFVSALRWAPYAYAYVNPLARDHSWELDYWGVSAREGVTRLRRLGLSPIYVEPSQQPGVPFGAYNTSAAPPHGSGLYVFLRWGDASSYGCRVIFTIERGGHALGEGALC